jgi:putative oxidoreductase
VILRTITAIPAIQLGIAALLTTPLPAHLALQLMATGAAAMLLVGVWTPAGGMSLALAEIILAFLQSHDPWIYILLGALGAALAMLGPGAWSVDARLFGRKRIQIPRR